MIGPWFVGRTAIGSKSCIAIAQGTWRRAGVYLLAAMLVALATGCQHEVDATPTPGPTPIPPVGVATGASVATASGEIIPAQQADLGFPRAGRVVSVLVEVGDRVEAGELLASLDRTAQEAAVIEAQAAMFQAQARLSELQAGPRTQEIAAALAHVDAAKARLAQLSEGARPEEIEAARASLTAAQSAMQQLYSGPRESERIVALVALSNAEAALRQAQAAYDAVAWRNDVSQLEESRALQQATNNLEAAQASYDALFADPDPDEVAEAEARVQQAQAALEAMLTPGSENQINEAEAQVRSAQAELDILTEGPRDEIIASATAAVTQAEAALRRAEAGLADSELRAPFAGTVTELFVSEGETVQPGELALTLASLDNLRVQTTDLSERDVARIAVGQSAEVFVESLGVNVDGIVLRIAPQATVIAGDVVYEVIIVLDEQPPALRWGMSVDVRFQEG